MIRWPRLGMVLAVAVGVCPIALASPRQDYALHCMGCHGASAQGVPGKVPALAQTLVEFMRSPSGRSYVLRVPGASNSALSDARLAEVLNWIAVHFETDPQRAAARAFTAEEVAAVRHTPLASVRATRREVLKELAATGPAPTDDY